MTISRPGGCDGGDEATTLTSPADRDLFLCLVVVCVSFLINVFLAIKLTECRHKLASVTGAYDFLATEVGPCVHPR